MAKPRKGHIVPKKHRKGNPFDKWRGPKRRKIEILEKKRIKKGGEINV